MTVEELRDILRDLPGHARVVVASGSGADPGALEIDGFMTPARLQSSGLATFDYWNDNDEDRAAFESESGESFEDLSQAIILFWR